MSVIPLVRAHQCYPFLNFLEGSGLPVVRLLERHRLPVKMLEAEQLYVDESRLWELIARVGHAQGIPDLGYRVGREFQLESLGTFGELLLRQPTLKHAIEILAAVISSEAVVSRFALQRQNSTHWFVHSHVHGAPQCSPMMEIYNLQCMLRVVQAAAGAEWLPPAIKLRARSLPHGLTKNMLTVGTVHFNRRNTALEVPSALLPLTMRDYLGHSRIARSDTIPASSAAPEELDFSTSVCWLLKGHIQSAVTINDVAEMVGLGERTFQRRLAQDGKSFQEILDQARFELAREQLKESEQPITEIALDLGYSDTANFSRAFRRWTGRSPRTYRKTRKRTRVTSNMA